VIAKDTSQIRRFHRPPQDSRAVGPPSDKVTDADDPVRWRDLRELQKPPQLGDAAMHVPDDDGAPGSALHRFGREVAHERNDSKQPTRGKSTRVNGSCYAAQERRLRNWPQAASMS